MGRSKAADVFRILDAIGEGKPGEALSILEELFAEGEDPMAVLGPLTAQLRKLAAVGRLHSPMDCRSGRRWTRRRCRPGPGLARAPSGNSATWAAGGWKS